MPRRHRTLAEAIGFHTPLARWGFTVLALLAFAVGLVKPCLVSSLLALYAWKNAR